MPAQRFPEDPDLDLFAIPSSWTPGTFAGLPKEVCPQVFSGVYEADLDYSTHKEWWVYEGDGTTAPSSGGDVFVVLTADRTDEIIEAIGDISLTGSGARTVTITVTDGSNPLSSALVRVTSGANSFDTLTNGSGVAVFNLDDATWVVSITKAGYSYAGSSIVVNGTETATLAMTAISFPVSPTGQVTGYWHIYTESGAVDAGAIVNITTANTPRSSTGLVLQDAVRQVTANGSGLLTVTGLFPGVTYKVYRQGSLREFIIVVPSNASSPVALGSIVG